MLCRHITPRRRNAFTLVELLVVMAIIAVLIGLLLPAVQRVREGAARSECMNNVRQIGLAVQSYNQMYNKKLPPAWSPDAGDGTFNTGKNQTGNRTGTFYFFLLPFLEQENIIKKYGNNAVATQGADEAVIPIFLCPSDASLNANVQRSNFASVNYACNLMVFDPRGTGSIVTGMKDGASNTVILAERYKSCVNATGLTEPGWAIHPSYVGHAYDTPAFGYGEMGHPAAPNFVAGGIGFQLGPKLDECLWQVTQTGHSGAMVVGMGDGSVRAVSRGVSAETWFRACHPSDGMPLGDDW